MSRQGNNQPSGIPQPPQINRGEQQPGQSGQPGQPGPAPRNMPPASNVTAAATQALEAVLEQSRTVHELVETIQHQSTQGKGAVHDEDADNERKVLKVRDNILASTI